MKAALVVSALLLTIACTRTEREITSTDTMRNFVLELQEECLSAYAKSIHHMSLLKRALSCSLGSLRRRFLIFVEDGLLTRT